MGMVRNCLSRVLGLSIVAMGGCNTAENSEAEIRPIGVAEATLMANERIDNVLTGFADATKDTSASTGTTIASDGLLSALGADPCSHQTASAEGTVSDSVKDGPDRITESLSRALTKIRDEAKEHIFREEFVELSDGNHVVYKLDPVKTCGERVKCVEELTRTPLRFDVTAYSDDSLNVALLVGEERRSPLLLQLTTNKISLTGNLAEALASLRSYVDEEDESALPEKLVGVTTWSIEKLGPSNFVMSSALVERFELVTGQAKGKPISVTVEPTSPLSEVTVDGERDTIGFRENLGTINVTASGATVCKSLECDASERSATFGLHFAGFTGEFETRIDAQEITFSGLGLGGDTSYLSLNNRHLAEVDLNPTLGRKFSMNLKKTAAGTLVTFEPALDLRVAMAMNQLSESLRVDMPDWLLDEVFDVTLGGAPKPAILVPATTCSASGVAEQKDQLQVIAGNLRLNASSLQRPVEVIAGMCLLPADAEAEQPNPMTRVAAGPCR